MKATFERLFAFLPDHHLLLLVAVESIAPTSNTAVESIRHKWFAQQIGAAVCAADCALLSQSDAH